MSPWRVKAMRAAVGGAGLLVAAALSGCAGSSSESPWPVEPNEVEAGPAGEQTKAGLDVKKLPNRYGADAEDERENTRDQKPPPKKSEDLEERKDVP